MKITFFKTILREIKKSLGRFVAIFAIVALGVGFLAGLLETTPDMQASVDRYYDKNRMTDIFIKSTMGLTDKDIEAVSSMDEIERVMPAYVTDTLMKTGQNEELVTRVYGLPLEQFNSQGFINRLELLEGRLPQAAGECLIERNDDQPGLRLGSTLKISEENEDYANIGDIYNITAYTVVGVVSNSFYFSKNSEFTGIGNGRIGAIIYVDQSSYALDVYTDLYITVKGASALNTFSDKYKNYIKTVTSKIKSVGETQSGVRYNEIVSEATDKLNDAKSEYNDGVTEAETKLADALKKLEDGKKEIQKSETKLSNAKKKIESGNAQLQKERENYQKMIESQQAELEKGEAALQSAAALLAQNKAQLDTVKGDIETAKALRDSGAVLPPEVLAQIAQYDAGLAAYNDGIAQLSQKQAELAQGRVQLENGKKEAEAKFEAAQAALDKARKQVLSGIAKLKAAKEDLASGEAEYLKSKAETEDKLNQAAKDIADGEKKIADIEAPEWYVLDRNSNIGYASFASNSEKVAAVATVFPIFFFLVAALVALTTMTRMVEEERTQIGTLKALGYTRNAIMSKYISYCGAATALGSIVGLLSGFQLLPTILYNAYAAGYYLPEFMAQFSWGFAAGAFSLAMICTMAATVSACNNALREKPAKLMLPRAPKAGKRIFLERIHFIWSRMKFTQKATARNIIRYKKHFFMTVIGIAGCTALILTGFGLRDSIGIISRIQYNDIIQYDLRIEKDKTSDTDAVLDTFLNDSNKVIGYAQVHSETGTALSNGKSAEATLYVPKDPAQLENAIRLRDRNSGEKVVFSDSSVILTEKLAEILDLRPGNTFILENADGKTAEFTVTDITENYVGSFVYMSQAVYAQALGNEVNYNTIMAKTLISGNEQQDAAIKTVLSSGQVSSAEFISQTRKTFDNLLSSINYVVIVLILAAGALAMIVLYNLTNININERRKELATLRVLGFHNREVAGYIFRETLILSIVGTLFGLLLGILLHSFMIHTAETTSLMFGRNISAQSYVLSAAATLFFSMAVNLLMYRKLKRIEMADSMKAVD